MTLPQAGFLPLFYNNADLVKSLHNKSIWIPEPISSPSPCLQQANIPTTYPKFYKLAIGYHTSGPWATSCRVYCFNAYRKEQKLLAAGRLGH